MQYYFSFFASVIAIDSTRSCRGEETSSKEAQACSRPWPEWGKELSNPGPGWVYGLGVGFRGPGPDRFRCRFLGLGLGIALVPV